MNNSGKQFTNMSQGAMKKTSQSNRSNQDNFQSSMNPGMTGREVGLNTQNNNSTLKGKLQTLEEDINSVACDMNNHKKELVFLKTGKDNLQDELKAKNMQIKNELASELNKVEEQMKTHFSHQKNENIKLQQQITQLKNDKTSLQTLLNSIIRLILALQRKIADLEMVVGNEEQKFI